VQDDTSFEQTNPMRQIATELKNSSEICVEKDNTLETGKLTSFGNNKLAVPKVGRKQGGRKSMKLGRRKKESTSFPSLHVPSDSPFLDIQTSDGKPFTSSASAPLPPRNLEAMDSYKSTGLSVGKIGKLKSRLGRKGEAGMTKDETSSKANEEWRELVDDKTGKPYWHNVSTGETSWFKPKSNLQAMDSYKSTGLSVGKIGNLKSKLGRKGGARKTTDETSSATEEEDWRELIDDKTGKSYWYNVSTGETAWSHSKANLKAMDSYKSTGLSVGKIGNLKSKLGKTGGTRKTKDETSNGAKDEEEWRELIDDKTGRSYWHNVSTGETTWKIPE